MSGVISTLLSSFGGSSLTANKLLQKDLARYREIFSKQPQVTREVAYFQEKIGKIETTDDLVKDKRLFKFILSGFGLEEKTDARAFMKKLLDEGLKTDKSMANRMADSRYKQLVRFIEIDSKGLKNLQNPVWVASAASKYITAAFEKEVGEANGSVRLAMYFERKASTIKSWYTVLADPALGEVVRSALSMPAQTAQIDIDKQVELFQAKMDLADFQDPAKVHKFVEKYLVRSDAESGTAVANSPVLQLLSGKYAVTGYTQPVAFDVSLLMQLNGRVS